MGNFYTYIYLDPRYQGIYKYEEYTFNYKPFYVGKGTGIRCYKQAQKNQIHKLKRSFKRSYLKGLFNLDLKPIIIKVHDNISEELAFKNEIRLIKIIGRRKFNEGPLTNISEGGDGISGYKHNIKTREKMSNSHKNIPLKEKHKINLHKANKNNKPWNKGIKSSENTIKKLSNKSSMIEHWKQGQRYKFISPKGTEHIVYDLKEFCIENDLNIRAIRRIKNNDLKNYKGWHCNNINEKYKVISPNGIISYIKSLNNFCKEYGLRVHSLRSVANGKRETYLGWKCIRL